ncbi:MAG: ribonuclease Z [Candidatus Micrarchaeia archaeon]
MKIIFLGTSGAVPSKERGMPSIAIHINEWILFDCGEGTQRQMMNFKIPYGSINSIFITHLHLDHYLGLFGLLETYKLILKNKKIRIFAPYNLELKNKNIELVHLKEGKIYENRDYEIHAFKVEHIENSFGFLIKEKDRIKFYEKKAKSLGILGPLFREIQEKGFVRIGKKKISLKDVSWIKKGKTIIYSGDTRPSKELIKHSKNADLLIHEATYLSKNTAESEKSNHSTSLEAAKIAKSCKASQLILTHISPRYKNEKELLSEAKKIFPKTEIACDGMEIEI